MGWETNPENNLDWFVGQRSGCIQPDLIQPWPWIYSIMLFRKLCVIGGYNSFWRIYMVLCKDFSQEKVVVTTSLKAPAPDTCVFSLFAYIRLKYVLLHFFCGALLLFSLAMIWLWLICTYCKLNSTVPCAQLAALGSCCSKWLLKEFTESIPY